MDVEATWDLGRDNTKGLSLNSAAWIRDDW